jgi:hypothetical protein
MSGNINTKNITSENITVTNLTVTNINGRPYNGSGGCTSCNNDFDPCDGIRGCEEIDPCDCFSNPCIGPQGPPGPPGPQGPGQPNFYINYTITQLTSAISGSLFSIPASTTDANYYNVYQVNTTLGPLTIQLPLISSLDNSGQRIHYIVDNIGQLSNHNLIIIPTSPNTIGGQSSLTIVVNYSSVQLMSNKNNQWLII